MELSRKLSQWLRLTSLHPWVTVSPATSMFIHQLIITLYIYSRYIRHLKQRIFTSVNTLKTVMKMSVCSSFGPRRPDDRGNKSESWRVKTILTLRFSSPGGLEPKKLTYIKSKTRPNTTQHKERSRIQLANCKNLWHQSVALAESRTQSSTHHYQPLHSLLAVPEFFGWYVLFLSSSYLKRTTLRIPWRQMTFHVFLCTFCFQRSYLGAVTLENNEYSN